MTQGAVHVTHGTHFTQILEPYPAVFAPLAKPEVSMYCLAATLRPETMCGQTNCWILPEGEYGVFELDATTYYILAPRAARNMAFQDIFPEWGKMPKQLATIKGKDLLGCGIKAPSTPYERIYMLPLTTISMTKGTAIVTSVPSDSPDDYAAFMDLKNPKKREFYGVQPEWIEPFELIPIIETEELGKVAAEFMCQKLKVWAARGYSIKRGYEPWRRWSSCDARVRCASPLSTFDLSCGHLAFRCSRRRTWRSSRRRTTWSTRWASIRA